MQDRYVEDVGDFARPGMPRALKEGREFNLGAARHRVPDETGGRNGDKIEHLDRSGLRAELDREPFDRPHRLSKVARARRTIESPLPVLPDAVPFSESMIVTDEHGNRRVWRKKRFARVLQHLSVRDLAFADPDDGVADDEDGRKGKKEFRMRIPLEGIRAAARDRCAEINHRDLRVGGGHDRGGDSRRGRSGIPAIAAFAAASGPQALFAVNPAERNGVRPKTCRALQKPAASRSEYPTRTGFAPGGFEQYRVFARTRNMCAGVLRRMEGHQHSYA